MTTVRHPNENLIHDIAAAFVDKPESLEIVSQPALDKAVYFALKGDPRDEGRLVGVGGCHVDALTFLVAMMGRAAGEKFTFRLITCARPEERTSMKSNHVTNYDVAPAQRLLSRILAEIGVPDARIQVRAPEGPQFSLSFVLSIVTPYPAQRDRLLDSTKIVIFPASETKSEKAIEMRGVEALGTLFRAIARKDGVKMAIAVEDKR